MNSNTDWGSLKNLVERYKAAAEKDAEFAKRLTGFDNLDGVGKFAPDGQKQIFAPGIYVIGAPPSAGKTTFCLQLCAQLADRGEEILFLTYEMGEKNLLRKLIARDLFEKKRRKLNVTAISAADIRLAALGNEDVVASLDEIAENMPHLRILKACWTAEELIGKLHAFAKTVERPPVICIDYLQLIPSTKDTTAKEKIDKLLGELRIFQDDTDSTLLLISSFNRSHELKGCTTLSSFKESGSIEYTADTILTLEPMTQNDETIAQADARERKLKVRSMQLRCLKNREGELYTIYFRYHAAHDTFEACTKEELLDETERHVH